MNKNRRAPMGMGRGRGNNEKAKDLGGTLKIVEHTANTITKQIFK